MLSHRQLWRHILPLSLLAAALIPAAAAQDPAASPDRTDFLAQCAACHGKNGDGKGTTELDRPARSFKDGGFSYGNTRSSIFRSMSFGIPGTPMPAFDSALTEDQRWALADYVISLGPPRVETPMAERMLVVSQAPIIVRGNLPPIVDGAPATPRGLLLGLTTGASFQYRCDDVRLLGVRQGEFVERADWTGRGGQPLRPLGRVTFLMEAGQPQATFIDGKGKALRARLVRTSTLNGEARLVYDLRDADGQNVARVTEIVGVMSTSIGSGFTRYFQVQAGQKFVELTARVVPYASSEQPAAVHVLHSDNYDSEQRPLQTGGLNCSIRDLGDGTFNWTLCSIRPRSSRSEQGMRITLAPGARTQFEVATGSCEEGGSAAIRTLLEEVR